MKKIECIECCSIRDKYLRTRWACSFNLGVYRYRTDIDAFSSQFLFYTNSNPISVYIGIDPKTVSNSYDFTLESIS